MIRASVEGATGYARSEMVRLLAGHPQVTLTLLTSRQYTGTRFDRVYPSLTGFTDLMCETLSTDVLYQKADVVFTALPHKIPMSIVPDLIANDKKVVDLTADFRFKDQAVYEAHSQTHQAGPLIDDAFYGLCEVNREKIRSAKLVGNPGCYPTSALLPLIPLIKNKLIDADSIIIDSKSGVSGAGRSLSLTAHYCNVNGSFKAYKVAAHRHNPEIETILSDVAGQSIQVTFTPHLVPMTRGMLTTIYASLSAGVSQARIQSSLTEAYANEPFIRLVTDHQLPDTLHVKGTNICDIGFKIDRRCNRLILISAIDNLGKGAAGQAVQNMNLMYGLKETAGLGAVPQPL